MSASEQSAGRLTASIVVFHSDLALLQLTLESLRAAARRLGQAVAVALVDNASGEDYRAALRKLTRPFAADDHCPVTLLESAENLGYGGGHNLALRTAGDFHLVLNPDVELDVGALACGMSRLAADTDVVMLSPQATGSDGAREYLCKRHPSVLVLMLRAFAPSLGWRWQPQRMAHYQMSDVCTGSEELDVPLVSGCFMLMRSSALHQCGGFDERYFLYFEDFDLSRRMAERGLLMFYPPMQIVHHGGYAARKGWRHRFLFLRNGIRFFNQYGWRWF